jgi:hypothetical protein
MSSKVSKELEHILATTPPEQVVDRIEELDPDWKHDLLPWQIAKPGEKIPWQAIYSLIEQPITSADIEWAQRKINELSLTEDA